MSNPEDKIVGYVALHPSLTMYCDNSACIVAGTQSALNKYLKSDFPEVSVFEKRKTKFYEVIEGMEMGGAYAFDKESFKIFKRLAKQLNLNLVGNSGLSSKEGLKLTHISLEKL